MAAIESGQQKPRWRDGVGARVILPSLALLALGLVALYWISRDVADELDRQALEREERVISTLVKTKSHHWGKLALDYAFWDDAYTHLSGAPDPEWIDGNFDQSVLEAQGATAFLLMTDEMTVEIWYGGERSDAAVKDAKGLRELTQALIAKRGPGPHMVDGLITWRGRIAMAGVSRLMRQNSTVDPDLPAKLVLFVNALTPATVAEWSQNLEIKNMALMAPPPPTGPFLELKTRRGESLGAIAWTSDAPGSKFLASHFLLRSLISALLMLAFVMLVIGWASTMRRLSAGAA